MTGWGNAFKASWSSALNTAKKETAALATDINDTVKWVQEKDRQADERIRNNAKKAARWVQEKDAQMDAWVVDKAVKFGNKVKSVFQEAKDEFGDMVAGATMVACKISAFITGRSKKPVGQDQFLNQLNSLVDKKIQGAGSESLSDAMTTLWDNRDNANGHAVQDALEIVAEERGKPLKQIRDDWTKYQGFLNEQRQTAKEEGIEEAPGLNQFWHPHFMASKSQLRAGEIVGDELEIDGVFGSLLSPTGGLAGQGNFALDFNDTAIGFHGTVHDPYGYLTTYHRKGPGYNYLGMENRDTKNPLTGHLAGIRYFRDLLGPNRSVFQKATDMIGEGVMTDIVGIFDMYGSAKDQASAEWNDIVNFSDEVGEL